MRVAIPIRKGTSAPQDLDAPSFLTALPAEIWNAIYRYVFVEDGPVVVVDAHEYTKLPICDCDEDLRV
jgi:hypothetical protein